jgi:hypothetical protein
MRPVVSLSCLALAACFSPGLDNSSNAGCGQGGGVANCGSGGSGGHGGSGGGVASPPLTGTDGGRVTGSSDPGGLTEATGVIYVPGDCSTRGARYEPPTGGAAIQFVLGMWERCTPPSNGMLPFTAQLLEIHQADWHLLEVAADGTLHRRLDLDGSGKVSWYVHEEGRLQIDFYNPAGGMMPTSPQYESPPDRLRFTYYSADVFDFVRLD